MSKNKIEQIETLLKIALEEIEALKADKSPDLRTSCRTNYKKLVRKSKYMAMLASRK